MSWLPFLKRPPIKDQWSLADGISTPRTGRGKFTHSVRYLHRMNLRCQKGSP